MFRRDFAVNDNCPSPVSPLPRFDDFSNRTEEIQFIFQVHCPVSPFSIFFPADKRSGSIFFHSGGVDRENYFSVNAAFKKSNIFDRKHCRSPNFTCRNASFVCRPDSIFQNAFFVSPSSLLYSLVFPTMPQNSSVQCFLQSTPVNSVNS